MSHDKVDWKHAPKNARWWAIDADGQAFWYCTPDIAPFTNFWHAEQLKAPSFDYQGDFKASLTLRPI